MDQDSIYRARGEYITLQQQERKLRDAQRERVKRAIQTLQRISESPTAALGEHWRRELDADIEAIDAARTSLLGIDQRMRELQPLAKLDELQR